MSEIKRATLISFGADKGEDKKQKLVAKTVRITFALPESNEGTCPVYNYKEELAVAKKKDKSYKPVNNGRIPNGLDPLGDDDDDDVRRIAQQMEAKYGMGPPSKKRQKGRKDDYADIGMGYDESDSFIDNTDGYDEIIPQYVTTLHGGFYINSGALEFKTDEEASSEVSSSSSSSSSDEEDDKPEKTSRKRVLETSESEGETETEKGKDGEKVSTSQNERKQQAMSNGMPLAKKKKLLTPEKIRQLKKGSSSSDDARKKTVKDLLKEKREVINVASPPESMSNEKGDTDVAMKENKKPVSMHNVVDTIDSVAKGSDNNNSIEEGKMDVVKESVNKDVPAVITASTEVKPIIVPSSEGENSRDSGNEQKTEIVQLPENLPEDISELIAKLKETAAKNTENKVFTSSVNKMILSLERKCRCLGKHSKNRIYQHLGPFLKCRKETLIRRAKNLLIEDDINKLKDLVAGLQTKINEAMPPLLENYEKESQKIVQKKFSRESIEIEENKQLRMPKRRFSWTEEIKKQFKEIVTIRRRLYTLEGKSKEGLDIQMNLYLKSEIQILWPDGWMSMAALLKIYNNLGEKKSLPTNSKPPSSSSVKEPAKNSPDPSSIKDVHKMQSTISKNNNVKPGKTQNVSVKDVQQPPSLPKGAKEMQKLATNSMLSIIPVTPKAPAPAESPKPVMNDLTINILENDRIPLPIEISKNSGISISPTVTPSVVVKASEESTVIRPIPDTIITPAEVIKQPEKPTKFVTPYVQPPDNWKPTKPPTDHKIENIIKPTKPENLTKPKSNSPSPENLSKPKITENVAKQPKPENLCKPKLDSGSKPKQEVLPMTKPKAENLTKPKSENFINLSKVKPENLCKTKTDKPELKRRESDDVIILDENIGEPEPRPPSVEKKPKENHVIDLTAHPELKRKPGPKSKTKYYDPSLIKPVKSASSLEASKMKQSNITETSFQENLVDSDHYYNIKKSRPEQKDTRPSSMGSSMMPKVHNDGDEIQKVMEDLKVLHKMSAPSRSTPHGTESVTSSPVSVISYNKNYTPKTSSTSLPTTPKVEPKQEYSLGFQEAFQRQFLNELKNTMSANQNTPTSSKGFNSAHSSSAVSHPEKYYMNANNNYAQQNANKYKTNYAAQQQGPYTLMDDMLANFISEYTYPKTANHKQKPQK